MADTAVTDWRVWKAATIAKDSHLPDGKPVREGDVLYVSSTTRDSFGLLRTFITPSPTRLALNIAIRAALEGARLKTQLWQGLDEKRPTALYDDLADAYAYFEQCMVAVTFAFQSVEAYANQLVAEELHATLTIRTKNGDKEWTASDVERNCSTSDKLADVLPRLGTIPSPKGKRAWEQFKKLKGLRDSTMHWKAPDQYVRGKEDKTSLYHRFLNHNPKEFPRWATTMLRHYTMPEHSGWIDSAEALLK